MYVYILKSRNKSYQYVGMTNNIERRLHEHNSGHVKSTKHYAPFDLISAEVVNNRMEARRLEKYYKSGIGREARK